MASISKVPLTLKARYDYLFYIYHTQKGTCKDSNNITLEEAVLMDIALWTQIDLLNSVDSWLRREVGDFKDCVLYSDVDGHLSTIKRLNKIYNEKFVIKTSPTFPFKIKKKKSPIITWFKRLFIGKKNMSLELNETINRMRKNIGLPSLVTEQEENPQDGNFQMYYHGGNLDHLDMYDAKSKKGSIVYGIGLYLTTSLDVAVKYAKGSRKLYAVKVKNDIKTFDDVDIEKDTVKTVFTTILSRPKYKQLLSYLDRINPLETINAGNLNTYLLNNDLITKRNMQDVNNFFKFQNVDGLIDYNTFGWGEKQLVLMNTKKIIDVHTVDRKDPRFHQDFEYEK